MDERSGFHDLAPSGRRYSTTDIPIEINRVLMGNQVRRSTLETSIPRSYTQVHTLQTREDFRRYHGALQAEVAGRFASGLNRDGVLNNALAQSPPVMHFPQSAEQSLFLPLQPPLARPGPRENPLVHDQQITMLRTPRDGRNQANGDIGGTGMRHIVRRVKAFLGYGNKQRRELVGLVWAVCFGFVQVQSLISIDLCGQELINLIVFRSPSVSF